MHSIIGIPKRDGMLTKKRTQHIPASTNVLNHINVSDAMSQSLTVPESLPVPEADSHDNFVEELEGSEFGILQPDELDALDGDSGNVEEDNMVPGRNVHNRYRLRSVNKGKALPSSSSTRFNWKHEGAVLQARYDKGHYLPQVPRCVKKTWGSVITVRRELQKHGADQRKLLRGKGALAVSGVIYALMSMGSQKIYVGQTVHTALSRFQQHVSAARRGESTPLHVHIRSVGIHKFYVIPLEVIPTHRYIGKDGKVDNTLFRAAASPRERFWIERLHSYTPRGYNVEWAGRKRHRHRSSPMKWARAVDRHLPAFPLNANVERDFPSQNVAEIGVDRPSPLAVSGARSVTKSMTSYSSRQFGYRDWERRCQFLIQQFSKDPNLLNKVSWERYASRNLWRMLSFLEKEKHDFESNASKYVQEAIRGHLAVRARPATQKRRDGRPCLSLEWTSQLLRAVPLGAILKSSESKSQFPADVTILDEVRVVRKLVKQFGRTVFNYGSVARKLDVWGEDGDANSQNCTCRVLFNSEFRPNNECVLTGNLNIVESESLRKLMLLGPKVRTHLCTDPLEAIEVALSDFVSMVSGPQALDKSLFSVWKQVVLNACTARLKAANVHSGYGSKDKVVLGSKDLKYLRFLQHHLVLVPVDKAANNIAMVCRRKYTTILRQELESDDPEHQMSDSIYHISEEGNEVVVARHVHHLKSFFNFEATPQRLAYLYWMPKLHKVPTSQRFIAAAFACTTTQLSKLMSDCLTKVLATLREKDDLNIIKTGIRRFFVVSGYEEVAAFFSRWPRLETKVEHRQLQTGDFSTMYTTIPHKDLIQKVSIVLDEVWEWVSKSRDVVPEHDGQHHNRVSLTWIRGRDSVCEWEVTRARAATFEHTASFHRFTKKELNTAISWLIENTFLVNGGKCRRQAIGIPMGTNCAPALANLYLYAYESAYIDKLVSDSQLAAATAFHMTFRLIDDVLSVDNPHFAFAIAKSSEDGGIYPSALSLNDTTISCKEVRFLGMSIEDIEGKLCFGVFDKRREFPFTVCRYPHKCSLIPTHIAYAVFTGLLHRYYRICSQFEHFCWNASLLARTLVRQGWQLSRLRAIFRRFLQSRLGLKWKCGLALMYTEFARQSR